VTFNLTHWPELHGLPLVMKYVATPFWPFASMPRNTPAHQALRCHTDLSFGRQPDKSWKRRHGRPNNRWLDQIRDDNLRPPVDVWREAIRRGHSGVTQRSKLTTRWRTTTTNDANFTYMFWRNEVRDQCFQKLEHKHDRQTHRRDWW